MSEAAAADETELDRELEEDPSAERNGVFRANGERILFPAAYTFRTDGSSLHVLDGGGGIAVVFAEGAWEYAISRGARFKWEWESQRAASAGIYEAGGDLGPERQ